MDLLTLPLVNIGRCMKGYKENTQSWIWDKHDEGVVVATECVRKPKIKIDGAITVKETVVFEASPAEERVEGV